MNSTKLLYIGLMRRELHQNPHVFFAVMVNIRLRPKWIFKEKT
jgi:hypothetical protein